ncbi:MAG: FG-GAP repeat protein [Myxococcales bacterium]|nr:FG-GAP repeat protein [Myxococcales bacterium]
MRRVADRSGVASSSRSSRPGARLRRRGASFVPLLAALVVAASGARAATEAKIVPADGAAGDAFGFSVAISGDTVAIGARADGDKGFAAGSACFYALSAGTWTLQSKVTALDGAFADAFGFSIALDADTAVVGASLEDAVGSNSGSAYVFTRTAGTWSQQQKLVAADAAAGDQAGFSVAVSGDTAVVGAFADDDAGTSSGSAYVFVRSGATWTQQQKLVAADAGAGDEFGCAVAISGDTIVVGARGDDDAGSAAGAAYVFTRSGSTWTQQQKLLASDGAAGDELGYAVGVDGDSAIVGAWHADIAGGPDAGAAYVFVRSVGAWSEQDKLVASDRTSFDNAGVAVAIDGDVAIVGASGEDHAGVDIGSNAGAAYVFTRSGGSFTEQEKLTASDSMTDDTFGGAVSVSGGLAIAGAQGDDDAGSNSGSAYVYGVGAPAAVPALPHGGAVLGLAACLVAAGWRALRVRRGA